MKILFVDDDEFIHKLVHKMLTEAGYELSAHTSVDDALDAYDAGKFDLIITDIVMPVKSGLDFMEVLRERVTDTPILAITAGNENAVDDFVNSAEFFADRTMSKPLIKADFLAVVKEMIETGKK